VAVFQLSYLLESGSRVAGHVGGSKEDSGSPMKNMWISEVFRESKARLLFEDDDPGGSCMALMDSGGGRTSAPQMALNALLTQRSLTTLHYPDRYKVQICTPLKDFKF
jgi:hypothetical protein